MLQPLRHGCRIPYPGVTDMPPSQRLPRIPSHRRGLYTGRLTLRGTPSGWAVARSFVPKRDRLITTTLTIVPVI